MFRSCRSTVLALLACIVYLPAVFSAPTSFESAKTLARQHVYHDRENQGTFYCGCQWRWAGRSGGVIQPQSCGYQTRAQPTRAARIEWEHIVPASLFGQQRQCWQQGGRSNCKNNDPVFNAMEANLHNLTPTVGELNADRSNFRFGILKETAYQHGQCDFKVEFSERVVEPCDEIKGQIARVWFYMHDHYNLRMSTQQQRLLMVWDKQHPPSNWEYERDQRISGLMGHNNPFVSGEQQWTLNHRNSGRGINSIATAPQTNTQQARSEPRIKGNQRSKVYHLSEGCPSFNQVSANNIRWFDTEAQAQQQGYRKAGNCR